MSYLGIYFWGELGLYSVDNRQLLKGLTYGVARFSFQSDHFGRSMVNDFEVG